MSLINGINKFLYGTTEKCDICCSVSNKLSKVVIEREKENGLKDTLNLKLCNQCFNNLLSEEKDISNGKKYLEEIDKELEIDGMKYRIMDNCVNNDVDEVDCELCVISKICNNKTADPRTSYCDNWAEEEIIAAYHLLKKED